MVTVNGGWLGLWSRLIKVGRRELWLRPGLWSRAVNVGLTNPDRPDKISYDS